ncbi:hypothetical protein, partial [Amycolatopsis lurida]|uniref:hypothetical protein n=1 Tax=Amycolatopsis lurida TaxID=31959 RepID=UPI003659DBA2
MTWLVAVLGFIGAVAGSWGGQLIAARREDRRWQREMQREEIRAKRESRKHWKEERLAAYTEIISSLDEWIRARVSDIVKSETGGQNTWLPQESDKTTAARRRAVSAKSTVEIIGSSDAIKATGRAFEQIVKNLSSYSFNPEKSDPFSVHDSCILHLNTLR